MYVGVIEWASESLRCPTVIVSWTVADVLRETGRAIQDYVFDDGGEIDRHRDTWREDMSERKLRDWYTGLWDLTTEASLSVYELATVGEPMPLVIGESTHRLVNVVSL